MRYLDIEVRAKLRSSHSVICEGVLARVFATQRRVRTEV